MQLHKDFPHLLCSQIQSDINSVHSFTCNSISLGQFGLSMSLKGTAALSHPKLEPATPHTSSEVKGGLARDAELVCCFMSINMNVKRWRVRKSQRVTEQRKDAPLTLLDKPISIMN